MIDKKAFRTAFDGFDKEIIEEIVSIYVMQHPEKFREMEQSLDDQDFNKLRFISHGLKGVLSQFYAIEARDQAKDIEFKAKELATLAKEQPGYIVADNHIIKLRNMIEQLKESSVKVIEELRQLQQTY